jgi:hypothetical protein
LILKEVKQKPLEALKAEKENVGRRGRRVKLEEAEGSLTQSNLPQGVSFLEPSTSLASSFSRGPTRTTTAKPTESSAPSSFLGTKQGTAGGLPSETSRGSAGLEKREPGARGGREEGGSLKMQGTTGTSGLGMGRGEGGTSSRGGVGGAIRGEGGRVVGGTGGEGGRRGLPGGTTHHPSNTPEEVSTRINEYLSNIPPATTVVVPSAMINCLREKMALLQKRN